MIFPAVEGLVSRLALPGRWREVSAGADEERPTMAALERLDTSVAHIARVYDYWLGGCFL